DRRLNCPLLLFLPSDRLCRRYEIASARCAGLAMTGFVLPAAPTAGCAMTGCVEVGSTLLRPAARASQQQASFCRRVTRVCLAMTGFVEPRLSLRGAPHLVRAGGRKIVKHHPNKVRGDEAISQREQSVSQVLSTHEPTAWTAFRPGQLLVHPCATDPGVTRAPPAWTNSTTCTS